MDNYLVAMATFAGIYALLALGLTLVWGMAGMINLGLVGFFAFGAYVSALLTKKAGLPIRVDALRDRRAARPQARAGRRGPRAADRPMSILPERIPRPVTP